VQLGNTSPSRPLQALKPRSFGLFFCYPRHSPLLLLLGRLLGLIHLALQRQQGALKRLGVGKAERASSCADVVRNAALVRGMSMTIEPETSASTYQFTIVIATGNVQPSLVARRYRASPPEMTKLISTVMVSLMSVLATCWNVPSKPPPAPFCRTSLTPITPPAGTANHRLLQTGLVGHSRRKMPVFHGPKWADSWHLVDFVGML